MEHKAEHKKSNKIKAASAPAQKKSKAISLQDNRPQTMVQRKLTSPSSDTVQLVKSNDNVIQLGGGPKIPGATKSIGKKEKQIQIINPIILDKYQELVNKYHETVDYIKIIKPQLDDDDDVKFVEKTKVDAIDILNNAKETIRELKNLPEPLTTSRRSNLGRTALESEIITSRLEMLHKFDKLKKMFPLHSGGFGAKGRAHNMDVNINPDMVSENTQEDNHYINNISLDGNLLSNNNKVYKESKTVTNHPTGPIVVEGVHNLNILNTQKKYLKSAFEFSSSIHTPQTAFFNNTPGGRDRGEGQYTNMNKTNAAGYAWLMGLGLGNQKWEWLHIRGAGLGGYTDSTNLVTGTRDANTHMIPFESNIRTLATLVGNNRNLYKQLTVKWSVSGGVKTHAYKTITIDWKLIGNDSKVKASGEANFSPLHTGSNISKKEVEALEDTLKEVRDGLPVQQEILQKLWNIKPNIKKVML